MYMGCIACNSQDISFDNEFLCNNCFEKIKNTPTEHVIKLYEKFMPVLYVASGILSILLIIIQIFWYLGKLNINHMDVLTFCIFGIPIIIKIILLQIVTQKIRNSEELKDSVVRNSFFDEIKQYSGEIVVLLLIFVLSIFIYQIWDLVFGILSFIWSKIQGLF
jgi:hypothetical protein